VLRRLNVKVAYLDIETNYVGEYTSDDDRFFRDSKNHLITVLGVRLIDNKDDQFVQIFDKDVTKSRLVEILYGTNKIVTYNGRSLPDSIKGRIGFDFPVIAAQLGIVLDKEFEHTDLCPECWRRDLYGGQKKIEQMLGLRRKLPGKDGAWAMEVYRLYVKTGDERHRSELLAYNREDVFMLRELEIKLATL
jgi:uncharacterized protein YprB with RNaseH-like and TPR domain